MPVVALTGQGGWPLNIFLTPDGEPFFGGTYFPPEPRHGLPSFRQLLRAVSDAYRERPEDVAAQAEALVNALRRSAETEPSREPLTEALLAEAEAGLLQQLDPRWGGFGHAPKFPPASVLEFLLRRDALEPVRLTLDGMAAGGMYDLVGGGFHRYSVDVQWLVPHFEKMLYDNALLVPPYLHAWVLIGEERYRAVAEQTLDYMLRELRLPTRLASSQDADTDGVEGLTYTWTPEEGAPPELLQPSSTAVRSCGASSTRRPRARLLAIGGASAAGPRRQGDRVLERLALAALARGRAGSSAATCSRRLSSSASCSPASRCGGRCATGARSSRVPRRLRERRTRPLRAARRERRPPLATGVAPRGSRRRRALRRPCARAASTSRRRRREARRTAEVFRRQPDAVRAARCSPSSSCGSRGSGGDDELERHGGGMRCASSATLSAAPSAFGWALCALDLHLSAPRELAIVGGAESDVARAALRGFDPNAVVAFGPAEDVPLLEGKALVDGRPAVYVCERFACRAPATDVSEL
jgi:hypothetical protein